MKINKYLALALFFLFSLPACAVVTSTSNRVGPFKVNVVPAGIPIDFPFVNHDELLVINMGNDGTANSPGIELVLNSDYIVDGGGYDANYNMQTGTVILQSGGVNTIASGDYITVVRKVPVNQPRSFTSGILTAASIERGLDTQATISQMQAETIGRALQLMPGETKSGVLDRASRSGKVLGFDSFGNISYYSFVAGEVVPQSVQGTLNQVLVNGAVGTPTTGSVTLTTPQDIATTSTPQFAQIGIGAAAATNTDLAIVHSLPTTSGQASVVVYGAVVAPAATSLFPNAYRDTTSYRSTVAADAYASYDTQASLQGTLDYNHFYGYQARLNYNSTGTLDNMSGFKPTMSVTAGTVTHVQAFHVPTLTNSATVDHYFGLYVDSLGAVATDVHAIWINGPDDVFMNGGQIATSALGIAVNTNARIAVTFDQSTQFGISVMNSNATATGKMIVFHRDTGGASNQGSINQVNNTTVNYLTTSDARLKENVRDMVDSGDIIDALRPRIFDWKWGGKDYRGFIAQELYGVYPEAVYKGDDGQNVDDPWSVDYSKLTPLLTAEVKSLRQRVAYLEDNSASAVWLFFSFFGAISISVGITLLSLRNYMKP